MPIGHGNSPKSKRSVVPGAATQQLPEATQMLQQIMEMQQQNAATMSGLLRHLSDLQQEVAVLKQSSEVRPKIVDGFAPVLRAAEAAPAADLDAPVQRTIEQLVNPRHDPWAQRTFRTMQREFLDRIKTQPKVTVNFSSDWQTSICGVPVFEAKGVRAVAQEVAEAYYVFLKKIGKAENYQRQAQHNMGRNRLDRGMMDLGDAYRMIADERMMDDEPEW